MAMPASRPEIGIDVAKDDLVIHLQGLNQTFTIDNTPQAIRQWLATLPEGCDIAIEATVAGPPWLRPARRYVRA